MTAYSVAAKRRARKARQEADPFALPEVPKRQRGTGRKVQPAETRGGADPRKTALEARCRQEGRQMTKQDRIAVEAPLHGSYVGLCILEGLKNRDQKSAWDAWCGYTSAMRTYERRILGKSVHAKTADIQMEPERLETDAHHTVDTRDEEQRDRDAVNNWTRWKGLVWEVGPEARGLIEGARQNDSGLWVDAAPTRRGLAVAYAVKALAKAVESR